MFFRSLVLSVKSFTTTKTRSLVFTDNHVLAVVSSPADDVSPHVEGVVDVTVGLVSVRCLAGGHESERVLVWGDAVLDFPSSPSHYKKFPLERRTIGWFDDVGWLLWAHMAELARRDGWEGDSQRRAMAGWARQPATVWRDFVAWRSGENVVRSAYALGAPLFENDALGAQVVGFYVGAFRVDDGKRAK